MAASTGSRSALLWLYGLVFFSQFKPSEPFLVDFLVQVTTSCPIRSFFGGLTEEFGGRAAIERFGFPEDEECMI